MDSECSYHISQESHLDLIKKLMVVKFLWLYYILEGCIGTIIIQMFDGIQRTLKNVRHVIDLKRNLVLLGILDKSGYSFKALKTDKSKYPKVLWW